MRLVDLIRQETGAEFSQIMLLRHGNDKVEKLEKLGGTIEEYTHTQPTGSSYDFLASNKAAIHYVVVIVRDEVYGLYHVEGIEVEGTHGAVATKPYLAFLRKVHKLRAQVNDLPARRFNLKQIHSAAIGANVTGWKGRNAVARSEQQDGSAGKNFWNAEIEFPGDSLALSDSEANEIEANHDGNFRPDETDRRQVIERQIRERRGQRQFRDKLRRRYASRCLITGCKLMDVLEAAHISPYRGEEDNHPENGLLLRSDIHTLFDLDLLGIDPSELRIELHPKIAEEYGHLAGRLLDCTAKRQPSRLALKQRYAQFKRNLRRLL